MGSSSDPVFGEIISFGDFLPEKFGGNKKLRTFAPATTEFRSCERSFRKNAIKVWWFEKLAVSLQSVREKSANGFDGERAGRLEIERSRTSVRRYFKVL